MSTVSPPPLPGASRAPGKPPRNWLQRNLKWALPLAAVLIVVGWLLLNWLGLRQMAAPLEASEPYRQAVARAAQHRQVQQALGEPIKAEPFPIGSIGGFGGMTNASMVIRISGPHGKGRINVDAYRRQHWTFDTLQVHLPGQHAPLDLRTEDEKTCALLSHCL